jgi:hypothetical protein
MGTVFRLMFYTSCYVNFKKVKLLITTFLVYDTHNGSVALNRQYNSRIIVIPQAVSFRYSRDENMAE